MLRTALAALVAALFTLAPAGVLANDNSCQWAFDGECDDANYRATR
jgi:hypothetical protein